MSQNSQHSTSDAHVQNERLLARRKEHSEKEAAREAARAELEAPRAPRRVHPALTAESAARVRTAPGGGHLHVQLDALELELVMRQALEQLESSCSWATLDQLETLEHHERASVCLYATGQALRVPVCVRGGSDDKQGRDAPGNGLGRLLGALARSSTALSASTAHRAIRAGHEAGTLARAQRLVKQAWCDDAGRSWRRKFMRGLVYVPAEALRALYLRQAWGELVAAIGRVVPRAWRKAAHLRARAGGYWRSIRPDPRRPTPRPVPTTSQLRAELHEGRSFGEIVEKHGFIPFARLRAIFKGVLERWQIRSSKRVRTTEGQGSAPSGASASAGAKAPSVAGNGPCSARKADQRAWQGGACQTPMLQSDASSSDAPRRPKSFLERMALELGEDHGVFH